MKRPSSRIVALARPELKNLIWGTIALTIGSGMTLMYPMVIQKMIDGIGSGGGRELVNTGALTLLALFGAGAVMGALRAWLFTVSGERIVANLRTELYASIIRQEIGFFDIRRTGELTNRLASDTTVLQNTVTVNVSMLLRFVIMGIGAIGFLFYTSWTLALITLGIVPIVAISAGIMGKRMRKLSKAFQDALAESTVVAEETISGVRTVRSFAREETEITRYRKAVDASFQVAKRRATIIAAIRGFIGFGGYGAIAAVLWAGGNMLVDGTLSIGELTSFLLYTLTVAFSLGAISGLYEDFMKAIGASERVFELLDRVPEVRGGTLDIGDTTGKIEFENVDFAYPTRLDIPVLTGLSIAIEAGEVVALVGPSGGGKSTVASLLSRLYDPCGGVIRLDDKDVTTLKIDQVRNLVGVVSQEPLLFATTVEGNIRYGDLNATHEQILNAAKAANAHDFISGFPEGYETMVGERGVKLSGGQKQRVAIARAILKNPKVLVLDEATSALDAESEHLVQEALERLMVGRTTIIIAHRLSTVREADRVCVLNDGKIVQSGRHDELVSSEGLYKRLVERQFA